jgi:hypothetical protein
VLTREEITKNGEIVHNHAHVPDQGVVIRRAGVVVGVVVLPVVVSAPTPVVTASACQLCSARGRNCYGTKNPTNHKSNTNNFGPHRSMFLSIDVNRVQFVTLINFYEQ